MSVRVFECGCRLPNASSEGEYQLCQTAERLQKETHEQAKALMDDPDAFDLDTSPADPYFPLDRHFTEQERTGRFKDVEIVGGVS